MKRVLTLIDEANIRASARDAGVDEIDWRALTSFLIGREPGREALETVLYVGLPPETEQFADERAAKEAFVHAARKAGMLVVTNDGAPTDAGRYSADIDVLMALDAMELGLTARPDVVVLATGDADFAPLVSRLRRLGIRVEVAGADGSIAPHLREAASAVVDLAPLFRAVAEGDRPEPRRMAGFAMGDGRMAEPPRRE